MAGSRGADRGGEDRASCAAATDSIVRLGQIHTAEKRSFARPLPIDQWTVRGTILLERLSH